VNARTESGTNTSSRPASHANVPRAGPSAPPSPIISARAASTTSVTGLTSANARTAPGIVPAGTNADDANTSGKTQMNPIDWAVSGSRTARPTNALIQENTKAKPRTSTSASTTS